MTRKKAGSLFCIADVQVDGFLSRLRLAARVIFLGRCEISFNVLEFLGHMSDELDGNTTCILTAPQDFDEKRVNPKDTPRPALRMAPRRGTGLGASRLARPKWWGGYWNEDQTLWTHDEHD